VALVPNPSYPIHPYSVVIAGTHGKTTTTSLVAWILERGGLNPSSWSEEWPKTSAPATA
jgi:UDP-N-acetylmuramate-alanine ligase